MSRFLTALAVEAADDTDDGNWRLTADLVYQSDLINRTITIPAGTLTDLASVPRFPLVYLLAGGTSNAAAALHDGLYQLHLPGIDRQMADAILREASQASGVPGWRRWMMWAGVRMGGGSHWENKATPGKIVDTEDAASHLV